MLTDADMLFPQRIKVVQQDQQQSRVRVSNSAPHHAARRLAHSCNWCIAPSRRTGTTSSLTFSIIRKC